jgi:hypothetical protein
MTWAIIKDPHGELRARFDAARAARSIDHELLHADRNRNRSRKRTGPSWNPLHVDTRLGKPR